MPEELPYDVFISYRQQEPEKSWVRETLFPRLTEANLRVLIDFKHFRLGAPLITEMERGVKQSRYTLVVATPKYFQSTFTEFENLLGQHLGLENSQHGLIVVMRETCDLTLRLGYKLWLSMTSTREFEENLPRLIEGLTQPVNI